MGERWNKRSDKNPERFWNKVSKEPFTALGRKKGCWEWTGGVNKPGYGKIWWGGVCTGAHRVSYELEHGSVPPSFRGKGRKNEIQHSCDNPLCVRPSHLVSGTTLTNQRDKVAKGRHHLQTRKTCDHGHRWTKENTGYIRGHKSYVDGTPYQVRYCKACHSIRGKKYHREVDKKRRQQPAYKKRKNARRRELYRQRKKEQS